MLRSLAGLSVLSALLVVLVTVGGPAAEAAPHISGFESTGTFKQLAAEVSEDLSYEPGHHLTGFERPLEARMYHVDYGADPAKYQAAGYSGYTK